MFALIKKAKKDLNARYLLPSIDDPVEFVGLDNSDWTLVEWTKSLITAEAINEIIQNAPDFIVFNDEDSAKVMKHIEDNFKSKEPK